MMGERQYGVVAHKSIVQALKKILLAVVLLSSPAGLAGCDLAKNETNALVIMAASSLTDSFTELASQFEAQHPGTTITLNLAGTQVLRTQLEQGAKADVFVAASRQHIEALASQGLVAQPRSFAQNKLVLIIPSGNPAGIHSIEDLVRPHRLVLAASSNPVGGYSRQVLARVADKRGAGFLQQVLSNLVSEENSVRSVLTKVALGEGDAGLVYQTDLKSSLADDVETSEIPVEYNVSAEYYISKITGGGAQEKAVEQFIEFVLSPEGQKILKGYGFQ